MSTKLDTMFEKDFLRLPRPFVRVFGLKTAMLLSELYSEYNYWKERDLLEKGGWFYSTIENMNHNSGLSKSQQLQACKELQEYGIIKVKYHGMPKKRYFKFNIATLDKLNEDFNAHVGKQTEVIDLDNSEETEMVENMSTSETKHDVEDSGVQEDAILKVYSRKFTGFSF